MNHLNSLKSEGKSANFREFKVNSIDDLLDIIFIKNTDNAPVQIECADFQSIKDLYFFCVELTLKGLQKMYGNSENNNQVDIATLSMQQIKVVQKKLNNAGIEVMLEGKEMTTKDMLYKDDDLTHVVNMLPTPLRLNPKTQKYESAEVTPESQEALAKVPLEEYLLVITKRTMAYHVRFKLINKLAK